MAKRPVLIELRQPPVMDQPEFFATAQLSPMPVTMEVNLGAINIPDVEIDTLFPAITIPAQLPPIMNFEAAPLEETESWVGATSLVRGVMDDEEIDRVFEAVDEHPNVVSIYSDVLIEPCLTCANSPAVGTAADVGRAICAPQLASAGMDGTGVPTGGRVNHRDHGTSRKVGVALADRLGEPAARVRLRRRGCSMRRPCD